MSKEENQKLLDDDYKGKIEQIQQKLNKLEEEMKKSTTKDTIDITSNKTDKKGEPTATETDKAATLPKKSNEKRKKIKQPQTLKQTITVISQGKEKQKEEKKTIENIRDKINKRIRVKIKENDDGKIKTKEQIDEEKAKALADKYTKKLKLMKQKKKN